MRSTSTRILSTVMVLLGLGMLVSTLARGGGPLAVGVLVGTLFCAVGVGRIYLEGRGS